MKIAKEGAATFFCFNAPPLAGDEDYLSILHNFFIFSGYIQFIEKNCERL